jgi:hypothetical protein
LHVAVAALAAQAPDLLDDARGVRDGVGVGHRVHTGEASACSGLRAGQHGLGVLPARLAYVSMEVDQSGQRDQTGGVDDLAIAGIEVGPDRRDEPVGDRDVDGLLTQQRSLTDDVRAHSVPSSASVSSAAPPSRR